MSFMATVILKEHPEIAAVIRVAFPSYKKQKAFLTATETMSLSDTYWSGGSRSTYVAVNIETLRANGAPQYDPPQFGGPQIPVVTIPNGIAIVEGGIFCGKPATAHVRINPSNMTKLLTRG